MASRNYYLFVTFLSEVGADLVISALVKNGWEVGPLADSGKPFLKSEDAPNVFAALQITASGKKGNDFEEGQKGASEALKDVREIIKKTKVFYYSVALTLPTSCTWSLGNISLDKPKEKPVREGEMLRDHMDHIEKELTDAKKAEESGKASI